MRTNPPLLLNNAVSHLNRKDRMFYMNLRLMRITCMHAKGIEKKLRKLSFKIISPPLVTYVEGKQDQMRLKEGELEKAKAWAQTIAEALSK